MRTALIGCFIFAALWPAVVIFVIGAMVNAHKA
jgi:hypothetical protein